MIKTELISKRCSKCRVLKGAEGFNKQRQSPDGHKGLCMKCESVRSAAYYVKNADKINAYSAKWAKENPEKVKAKSDRWIEANPEKNKARFAKWKRENKVAVNATNQARRARLMGAEGRYDKDDWARILDEWDHKCAGCRCEGALAVDHIVSLRMGGSNWPHNLQPLCQPCNSTKGAKSYSFIKPF